MSVTHNSVRFRSGLPFNTVVLFVPQQEAWVVERFGKFHRVLEPVNSVIFHSFLIFSLFNTNLLLCIWCLDYISFSTSEKHNLMNINVQKNVTVSLSRSVHSLAILTQTIF